MKVILREDMDNLGAMGETVNVARGYARNYLLPRNMAVLAESASAKQIEHELHIIKKRETQLRVELSKVTGAVKGIRLEFAAKAGESGKLFGSITTKHIADKLAEHGHEVDRRKIKLSEPIKTVGERSILIRLMKDVEAEITVAVIGEVVEEEVVEEVVESPDKDDDDEMTSMADAESYTEKFIKKQQRQKERKQEREQENKEEMKEEVKEEVKEEQQDA
ncbi:MAG: 50S ribosomal protein L9 [Candidatus Hydrogenedentes bacterium]|jgi:large subunit ribosomal protein L9|nr:50S ribosomal protein L9 [Candidatus Hydrogenedentota bacterium]